MATFNIGLRQGLNLISVPLLVTTDLSVVFGGTSVVEVRRIVNGVWQSFIPTRSFNDFSTFDPQYGYLIKASSSESIVVSGTEPVSTIFSLNGEQIRNKGLNLVGVPIGDGSISIDDYFVDRLTLEPFAIRVAYRLNALYQRYESYVPERPASFNFNAFQRGEGYLVLSDQSTELEIEY